MLCATKLLFTRIEAGTPNKWWSVVFISYLGNSNLKASLIATIQSEGGQKIRVFSFSLQLIAFKEWTSCSELPLTNLIISAIWVNLWDVCDTLSSHILIGQWTMKTLESIENWTKATLNNFTRARGDNSHNNIFHSHIFTDNNPSTFHIF